MDFFGSGKEPPKSHQAPSGRHPTKRKIIQHDSQGADLRRQTMICYARAAIFLKHYLNTADLSEPPPTNVAARVIQELIDLSAAQPLPVLLSLTTLHGEGADYLPYHHVNVALMVIAFARELGFTRHQIRDAALAALFHETGQSRLPQEYFESPGALSPEAKESLQKIPTETVFHVLNEKSASFEHLRRIVIDMEISRNHAQPDRDEHGTLLGLLPVDQPRSIYSEIISICCVYDALRSVRPYRSPLAPEAAILLMWSELRQRFNADLLKVFMRMMFIAPLELKGEQASRIIQSESPE